MTTAAASTRFTPSLHAERRSADMPTTTIPTRRASARQADTREYRLICAVAFLFFLPIVTIAHLMPRGFRERMIGSREAGRSVFADARAMVANTIPYAFMG